MGLIVCFVCQRQRQVKPIKRNAVYRCGNCGRTDVLLIRRRQKLWENWNDRDGLTVEIAPYQVYAELKQYCENKRYKNGWVGNKFKSIFGRWPNGEASAPGCIPSPAILQWIRAGNKSFAKRKREEEASARAQTPTVRLVNMGGRILVGGNNNSGAVVSESLMTEEDWDVRF